MGLAELYRKHAENAARLAQRTGSSKDHECLMALARNWTRAAEKLEQEQECTNRNRSSAHRRPFKLTGLVAGTQLGLRRTARRDRLASSS